MARRARLLVEPTNDVARNALAAHLTEGEHKSERVYRGEPVHVWECSAGMVRWLQRNKAGQHYEFRIFAERGPTGLQLIDDSRSKGLKSA